MRRQKFGNKKTTVDNVTFDSKKEAARYEELKMLEAVGTIKNLELQPRFEICPPAGGRRARFYVADFQYEESGETVVEDVKGVKTQVYTLKRQLFLAQYPQYTFIET